MTEHERAADSSRTYSRGMTEAQATTLLKYAQRGEVAAFSAGVGSNGYPPGPEAWLLLISGRALWVADDGSERGAS